MTNRQIKSLYLVKIIYSCLMLINNWNAVQNKIDNNIYINK